MGDLDCEKAECGVGEQEQTLGSSGRRQSSLSLFLVSKSVKYIYP